MLEPWLDCSTLLVEELPSFTFRYVTDSQVVGTGSPGPQCTVPWRAESQARRHVPSLLRFVMKGEAPHPHSKRASVTSVLVA